MSAAAPELGSRGAWAADWALLGAVFGFGAPWAASWVLGMDFWHYGTVAGTLGAVTGAGVGMGLRALLVAVSPRTRLAVCWVVSPVALGAWGALVAGGAFLVLAQNDTAVLATLCGTVSGWILGVWFTPLYATVGQRGPPWRAVVVAAGCLTAPFAGPVAAVAVLALTGWL